ncbi:HAMP domain-containing sensor histidine kinase [Larkinella knui]|uniref:histidine kinase n=1 Tax=Larkinella knui TaxID=2025310 RepID=A0A3P1CAW8_9BACT|nr:HAMP domain-containing sensor histidine kinase [Larkinella knui]RRB10380.1 sensor histidine kinase [Larkinella knui]
MTIRTRLTLRFTGLVSAILALAFACLYAFCWYFISSDFYRRLDRKADTVGELLIHQRLGPPLLSQFTRLRKDQLPAQKIAVYDGRNSPVFITNEQTPLAVSTKVLDEIRKKKSKKFRQGAAFVTGVRYATASQQYVVLASAENRYGDQFLRRMLGVLIGLFGAIVGVVAFSGWLYAGEALRPMQRMEQQLNHIFPNTLQERLPVSTDNDEISRLSITINRLLDRIDESFRLQRMFVANVSHELKNPLTQMSSQLEVALLNRREPAVYEEIIRSVLDDVGELSTLTRDLLQLSQVNQTSAVGLLTDSVRLDEVVWDIREEVSGIHPRYEVTVQFDELPDDFNQLTVPGNTALLRTALKNLTENACKFSSDGKASIQVRVKETAVQISVQNQGVPIPADDLPYIFEPFYRSRQTAEVRGNGVGLSLVERIIRLHQGKVTVSSGEGQPTVFHLELIRELTH